MTFIFQYAMYTVMEYNLVSASQLRSKTLFPLSSPKLTYQAPILILPYESAFDILSCPPKLLNLTLHISPKIS